MPLEKDLEERCRKLTMAYGGKLIKLKSPGNKGIHDRLLLMYGYVAFVEFKKDKKAKVQPLQNEWQVWLQCHRIPAFRVWTFAQFEAIVLNAPTEADPR